MGLVCAETIIDHDYPTPGIGGGSVSGVSETDSNNPVVAARLLSMAGARSTRRVTVVKHGCNE